MTSFQVHPVIMVSQENQRLAEQLYDKRPSQAVDALQQGPRKKPLVACFALPCSLHRLSPVVMLPTLLSIMGDTLGEPYIHCAMCMP